MSRVRSQPGVDLSQVDQEVQSKYPDLRLVLQDNRGYLRGTFPVVHDGRVLDRYQVEIRIPQRPSEAPELREIGGRIPHLRDRHHINPGDGTICWGIPELWLLERPSESMVAFLDGPVRDYFLGQSLLAAGESLPFGEWDHGIDGLLDGYSQLLGIEDRQRVEDYLRLLTVAELRGHLFCPCGSGERIRKCHRAELLEMRERISPDVARAAVDRLEVQRKALPRSNG